MFTSVTQIIYNKINRPLFPLGVVSNLFGMWLASQGRTVTFKAVSLLFDTIILCDSFDNAV